MLVIAAEKGPDQMSKVVLDVPDISCAHCAQAIAKALTPQQGIKNVQVDVPGQKVRLEYDESAISLDRVKSILAAEEYPVATATAV
jgi:copper chaperone